MKKEQKQEKKQEKKYYDVIMEADVPSVIKFRVLAESPEDAVKEIKTTTGPIEFRPLINKRRNKKAIVYEAGSLIIKHSERYR